MPGPDAGTSRARRIGDRRPRERLPRLVLGALCVQQLVRLPVSLWGAAPPAPMAQARSLRPERGVALLQGSGVAGTVSWGGGGGGLPSDVSLPETNETREYGRASAAVVFSFLIPSHLRPERLFTEPRLHSRCDSPSPHGDFPPNPGGGRPCLEPDGVGSPSPPSAPCL